MLIWGTFIDSQKKSASYRTAIRSHFFAINDVDYIELLYSSWRRHCYLGYVSTMDYELAGSVSK